MIEQDIERLNQALDMVAEEREAWKTQVAKLKNANVELQLSVKNLRSLLEQRGPYCAQHGELQPCPYHKWVDEE